MDITERNQLLNPDYDLENGLYACLNSTFINECPYWCIAHNVMTEENKYLFSSHYKAALPPGLSSVHTLTNPHALPPLRTMHSNFYSTSPLSHSNTSVDGNQSPLLIFTIPYQQMIICGLVLSIPNCTTTLSDYFGSFTKPKKNFGKVILRYYSLQAFDEIAYHMYDNRNSISIFIEDYPDDPSL